MIQTFDFAGSGRQIDAAGSFFSYERGQAQGAPVTLRVRAGGQDLGPFQPGDFVRLPDQVTSWEITPVSAVCVGQVRIGPAEFNSRRIAGQVEIAPSVYQQVMQDRAYFYFYGAATNAGFSTESQIWVPATSKSALIIGQVMVTPGRAGWTAWHVTDAPLPTLTSAGCNSKRNARSYLVTGAQFECRELLTAAVAPIGSRVYQGYTKASDERSRVLLEPAIILPGFGLNMRFTEDGLIGGYSYFIGVEFIEKPLSEL